MAKHYLLPKRLGKHLIRHMPQLNQVSWWLEALFFRALVGLARLLPFATATRLLAGIFGALGYRNAKKSKVVRGNLRIVMPEASEAELEAAVRDVFRHTGRAAAELFQLDRLWREREQRVEFSIDPAAEQALSTGRPIVFVTAHVGAWQLCNFLPPYRGMKNLVLYAEDANPWLRKLFLRLRQAFQAELAASEGGVRQLLRALGSGYSVGAAYDTRLDSGEMIPLFGVPAPTNTVPARLALRGPYSMIPVRCKRLPQHRFRIEVEAPIEPPPGQETGEQVMHMIRDMNARFEQWISEDPGQWACLKRRWPKARKDAGLRASR